MRTYIITAYLSPFTAGLYSQTYVQLSLSLSLYKYKYICMYYLISLRDFAVFLVL